MEIFTKIGRLYNIQSSLGMRLNLCESVWSLLQEYRSMLQADKLLGQLKCFPGIDTLNNFNVGRAASSEIS